MLNVCRCRDGMAYFKGHVGEEYGWGMICDCSVACVIPKHSWYVFVSVPLQFHTVTLAGVREQKWPSILT